jgi:hypothetical protein
MRCRFLAIVLAFRSKEDLVAEGPGYSERGVVSLALSIFVPRGLDVGCRLVRDCGVPGGDEIACEAWIAELVAFDRVPSECAVTSANLASTISSCRTRGSSMFRADVVAKAGSGTKKSSN